MTTATPPVAAAPRPAFGSPFDRPAPAATSRRDDLHSPRATARLAGLLYLGTGICVFPYIYLPAAFIVPGDAAATARRIVEGALTYRLGIVADLAGQLFFLLLALTLYHLLRDVDRRYARAMVMLVGVGAAVQVANVLNLVAPLVVLSGASYLSAFTAPQLDALALGFLKLRASGLFVSQVFWGLWLFPFGVLVIRSGFLPKVLGVALIVACVAYVAASVTAFVLPAYAHVVSQAMMPLEGLGEGSTLIWLIARGVKSPPPGVLPRAS